MAKMKALLPTALLLGGAYFLPPTAFAQTMPDSTAVTAIRGNAIPNAASFEPLLAVPKRIITEESATQALQQLKLDKNGAGALTWSNRTGENGNYTFVNVRSKDKRRTLNIKTMTTSGLRMDGKIAIFDRLDMNGFKYTDDADGTIKFDRISMAKPSPEATAWLSDFLRKPSDLNLDFEDEDINMEGFGALYLNNLAIDALDGEVRADVSEVGWGENADNKGTLLMRKY